MFKLLIADDEWVHRHTLKKFFLQHSHEFIIEAEAEDGKEALRLFISGSYDAVLTDIKMPVMDGLSLLEEIHNIDSSIPVILVSSYTDFEYAMQGIKYGVFEYLLKPVEKKEIIRLSEKLKSFLDKKNNDLQYKETVSNILTSENELVVFEEHEEQLFSLLLSVSSETDRYLMQLMQSYLSAYDHDIYKLGLVFDKIYKTIETSLFRKFEFVEVIYNHDMYSQDFLDLPENTEACLQTIKTVFSRLTSFIQLFHLDQSDRIVKALCEYAVKEIEGKPTLDDAARQLNYNSDYIGKLFKSKTGESYSQFCSKLKLEYAKKLIQTNAYNNAEICDKIGYKDIGYFSRLFKEYTGTTVTEFRKNPS